MAFFEELEVWRDAKTLTLSIYQIMHENHDYGFRDQIQRASVSIMNNIAEGSEAGFDSANIRFLHIAKGSCAEVRIMLYLCADLGYCNPEQIEVLLSLTRKISAYINRLIAYIKSKNVTNIQKTPQSNSI
ncbi:MAG: four helix bundle protein [Bacteroidales bacterium]|nr:four helix bundle protein [Bacteroidales bacterium]